MKTRPYRYQRWAIKRLAKKFKGRGILADEMGIGKSLQALGVAERLDAFPLVIVCKANLRDNWSKECKMHLGLNADVCETLKPPKLGRIDSPTRIYIINYDILNPAWVKYIRLVRPKMVVIDECHEIKTRTTRKYKGCRALCKGVKHLLALSGTPIENHPGEFWTVLNLVWPKKFPSYFSFVFRYTFPEKQPWGWKFKGARHTRELNRRLIRYGMIRRLKKDVLKKLPKQKTSIVEVEITRRKYYEEAENDFVRWLRKYHKKHTNPSLRAQRLVKYGYMKRLVGRLKVRPIMKWIDNFLETKETKIILFMVHKKVVRRYYQKYHRIAVVIDGSKTRKQRREAEHQFNKHKDTRIMICNIDAGGLGWNGIAADTVGFCELGWTPPEHTQGAARVHRIGQISKTYCKFFLAKDTIEERVWKLIQAKKKDIDGTLDGGKVNDALSIMDSLERKLLRRRR